MPKEYTLIGGNGTVVSPLEATEDGTYTAGDSRAFNPVVVRTGGGGSSTLSGLTDVDLTNPSDGQTLVYDAASQKWVNGNASGGGLVVHYTIDGGVYILDKTWQEIADAMLLGPVLLIDESNLATEEGVYSRPLYYVESSTTTGEYTVNFADYYWFVTDSPNGYPRYVLE